MSLVFECQKPRGNTMGFESVVGSKSVSKGAPPVSLAMDEEGGWGVHPPGQPVWSGRIPLVDELGSNGPPRERGSAELRGAEMGIGREH